MNLFTLLVLSGLTVVSLASLCVVIFQHRRMKLRNDRRLISRLREYDRLACELERTRIEKDLLEELLKEHLNEAPPGGPPGEAAGDSPGREDDDTLLLVKTRRLR